MSSSRLTRAFDVCWVLAFGIVMVRLLVISGGTSLGSTSEIRLELNEGRHRYGLYYGERRVGTAEATTKLGDHRWHLHRKFLMEKEPISSLYIELRDDLSLHSFDFTLNVPKLGQLKQLGSFFSTTFGLLALGQVEVHGDCRVAQGHCRVTGFLGQQELNRRMTIGRGPVLTSAVYPLLARGALGGKAEIQIFDPITLKRRRVAYRVLGREPLTLRSRTVQAIKVEQRVGDLSSTVWLDSQGTVLKEQLFSVLTMEHELDE